MKKILSFVVAVFLVSVLLPSCEKEEEFDETLLYGTWRSGTLYYKYLSNGKGSSWDTKDDVDEDDQPFTWSLVKSEIRMLHLSFGGGTSPETFIIAELTATTLKCKDAVDNRSYSFTKVNPQ